MKKKFGSNKFEKIINGWGIGIRSGGGEKGGCCKKNQNINKRGDVYYNP